MSEVFAQPSQRMTQAPNPETITKMLEENTQLVSAIVENFNKGRIQDTLDLQKLLHRNLVFLACLAYPNKPISEVQNSLPSPETGRKQILQQHQQQMQQQAVMGQIPHGQPPIQNAVPGQSQLQPTQMYNPYQQQQQQQPPQTQQQPQAQQQSHPMMINQQGQQVVGMQQAVAAVIPGQPAIVQQQTGMVPPHMPPAMQMAQQLAKQTVPQQQQQQVPPPPPPTSTSSMQHQQQMQQQAVMGQIPHGQPPIQNAVPIQSQLQPTQMYNPYQQQQQQPQSQSQTHAQPQTQQQQNHPMMIINQQGQQVPVGMSQASVSVMPGQSSIMQQPTVMATPPHIAAMQIGQHAASTQSQQAPPPPPPPSQLQLQQQQPFNPYQQPHQMMMMPPQSAQQPVVAGQVPVPGQGQMVRAWQQNMPI